MAQVKKPPNKNNASQSQSLTKKGAQGVSSRGKNAGEKAVVLASTKRALQLRNGKGGSFGTGEVVRIPGREKLELIAEDEMEKTREERRRNLYEDIMNSSLKAPFQLDTVLKIAQSQMDAYIDFINALRDPALCYDIVQRMVEAHCPPRSGRQDADSMRDPSFVAEQFGICVHNAHMLASGWVILYESFQKLRAMGLRDKEIRTQLQGDPEIRDEYFSAYGLLQKLVSSLQHRLRSIAQNTPHYAPYFKVSSEARDCQEFENSEIKRVYKSFLDSAIIELCLPGSKFSPQALYFCLHTTQEETPKLLRRCPQLMWDTVGDLAEAVRLLDVMETPLISRTADEETEGNFSLSIECARWSEAQEKSVRSAMQYSNFVNLVHPLENLKVKEKLDAIWEQLNSNYVRETGSNIDALWRLADARRRIPYFSTLNVQEALHDASRSSGKELVLARRGGKPKPKRDTDDGDSDSGFSSMPSLKAISDSEEEFDEFSSDDSDDDDDDSEDDGYDSDAEEELKRQQREAIDKALEDPDVLDLNNDKYAEERKKNPLLSLLGNLRGRLFSSSAILRTDEEPTAAPRPSKPPTAQKSAVKSPTAPDAAVAVPRKETLLKTTVEYADDESDAPKSAADKKKKKHKKKKKKKKSTGTDEKPLASEPPTSPTSEPPRSPSPTAEPQVAPAAQAAPPQTPQTEKKPNKKSPSVKTQTTARTSLSEPASFASTSTLPLPQEQKAPSARSYLKEIPGAKTKVKTRREPAPETDAETTPMKTNRKGGLFGRLKSRDDDESKEDKKKKKKESDRNIFARLRKKTAGHLRKLLGVSAQDKKGSLKWEQFLQVMRELGFDYDPSTAGSSVRFDPPNPDVRSITFHKPHPDPTLHQNILKEYRAKLESHYGWSPEVFKKAMDGVMVASSDSDY
ncbi:hypothetical protein ACEPAH_6626 [Sanghuangporus vaninii]